MKKQDTNKSHKVEDPTLKELEDLFMPCRIKKNMARGKRFDYTVEIINPLTNQDQRLSTGKRFNVVLYASMESAVNIDSEKIAIWQKSNVPLMVVHQESRNKLKYLWIDERFLANLRAKYGSDWMTLQTINLPKKFFAELVKQEVPRIEGYLMNISSDIKSGKTLHKGVFFELRKSLVDEINKFLDHARAENISLDNFRFSEILERAENSIYTVAIVGPSRTGKSTLINALMKEEISPVNVLPTTGVPFTIQPGKRNYSQVIFHDRPSKEGDASVKFLEKYIDQRFNPGNRERVKLVTVYLVNKQLEKGLAYCDVPGLDDVNPEIRRISKIAVYSSNAIIYLIDVAPFKFGSFSINSHHLDDLRELAPRMDRLYLVFNKVDILTPTEFSKLQEYINSVLDGNDLRKYLPNAPIYISAKRSFENVSKKKDSKIRFGIEDLENTLWNNLLTRNKNGLYNLGGITYEFKDELNKLASILKSRMIESENAKQLLSDLDEVQDQLSNFSNVGERYRNELTIWLRDFIKESVDDRLTHLEKELRRIPVDSPLPSTHAIKQFLETEAYSILTQVYDEVNYKLDTLYNDLNFWVKQKLSQVDFLADGENSLIRDKDEIDGIIRPIRDSFSQSIPAALSLLEQIFSAIGDLFVGIFTLLERIFIGKRGVRAKQINQAILKARNSYTKVFTQTQSEFTRHINIQCRLMIDQVRDRTQVYVGQIKNQLKLIGTPPDEKIKSRYVNFIGIIEEYITKLERIKNELNSYSANQIS